MGDGLDAEPGLFGVARQVFSRDFGLLEDGSAVLFPHDEYGGGGYVVAESLPVYFFSRSKYWKIVTVLP